MLDDVASGQQFCMAFIRPPSWMTQHPVDHLGMLAQHVTLAECDRPIIRQPLLFCGMRYSIRSFLSAENGGKICTSTFTLSFGENGGKI